MVRSDRLDPLEDTERRMSDRMIARVQRSDRLDPLEDTERVAA